MTWADALGIGLGLLSIPVNAVAFYLVHRAVARCCCNIGVTIGGTFGDEPDDHCDEGRKE